MISLNLVTLLYLIASVCFIQALKGLSHPTTSRIGNAFGMAGMTIAVLTTAALITSLSKGPAAIGLGYVLVGLVIGGSVGTIMAKRVEMTKMPELVAFMHSMIGLAAVAIAVAIVGEPQAFGLAAPGQPLPVGNRLELFIGTFVGAITFSGSVIAFGKLSGKYKFRLFQGAPVVFAGQHLVNLTIALAMVGCGVWFMLTQAWTPFIIMTILAFI
ncbi:MAG: NAD(P)(+) transhydrogenase (Re/Si-specific) subunit beta, partial [Burkholderiaceae bacterium]|nr:NAD(P)(+) transhydrogenase (Re/Si-specific) subunit beta [Burkholderiaceae bacterium]